MKWVICCQLQKAKGEKGGEMGEMWNNWNSKQLRMCKVIYIHFCCNFKNERYAQKVKRPAKTGGMEWLVSWSDKIDNFWIMKNLGEGKK